MPDSDRVVVSILLKRVDDLEARLAALEAQQQPAEDRIFSGFSRFVNRAREREAKGEAGL